MRQFSLLLLLFSMSFGGALAQDTTSHHFAYFKFDQYDLSQQEQLKLDSIFSFQIDKIKKVELIGHTDNYGSDEYNHKLSQKRVIAVQQFLQNTYLNPNIITINSQGEAQPVQNNDSDIGRQKNRRVEIIIYKNSNQEILPNKDKKIVGLIKEDTLSISIKKDIPIKENSFTKKDTTLIINEVLIEISKEDLEKYKDCIQFDVTTDAEAALQNNLTTMTVDNSALISCGMISITLDPPCGGCFEKPIKVKFPIPKQNSCNICSSPSPFNISNNGRWDENNDSKIRQVRINGKRYYEMTVLCPGSKNCDCIKESKQITFKVPRKYKIEKLNVVFDCPLGNYSFLPKRNKAKGYLPCVLSGKDAFVYATIFTKKDTFQLERIPIAEFQHSLRRKCKQSRRENMLWIFRRWRYKTYARYRLQNSKVNLMKKRL